MKRILVVGSGLTGSTIARVLAENDFLVDVLEQRNHIGGNVFDLKSTSGIRYHLYGPHLFHTNNMKVVDFLSGFTKWDVYHHKVRALDPNGEMVVFPLTLSERSKYTTDAELDIFIKPYSHKMWGMDHFKLHPSVIGRIKKRQDNTENYFLTDRFQAIPDRGYTHMLEQMLNHPGIHVFLNEKFDRTYEDPYDHVFYTGSIDEYFNFVLGLLPYRSIKFTHREYPMARVLPSLQLNFTVQSTFTRVCDWSYLPENAREGVEKTVLSFEEPCDFLENDFKRFYPIPDLVGANRLLYEQYQAMASKKVTFVGRLGKYAYINMDQAVASALKTSHGFIRNQHI